MLGEELSQQAVSVTFHAADLSITLLERVIEDFSRRNRSSPKSIAGEQTVKELYKKGYNLPKVPIEKEDLQGLRRELKNNGVDFHIVPNPAEKDAYTIYFKGKDTATIDKALQDYVAKKYDPTPQKKTVKEKMKEAEEKAAQQKAPEQDKERAKGKEKGRDDL